MIPTQEESSIHSSENILLSTTDTLLKVLQENKDLSLDTETTGLRPYHGDRAFIYTLSDGTTAWWGHVTDEVLSIFRQVFTDASRTWVFHNTKFDCHFVGAIPAGFIWDTQIGARLEFNDHISYKLSDCASRIGEKKDDAVADYIKKYGLSTTVEIPGKDKKESIKHFDKVPLKILVPYACQDARVTFKLYQHQLATLGKADSLLPDRPASLAVMATESEALKTLYEMERGGALVDRAYCEQAIAGISAAEHELKLLFKCATGKSYMSSNPLFQEVFASDKGKWVMSDAGNPSFDSDNLKKFQNPLASTVLKLRELKARINFFHGFLYHADRDGYVHPTFNPAGTSTGRLSSSNPNFQNLTNDEDAPEEAFPVRRAIIAPKDYCIVSIDWDQQEYRLLMDYAGEMPIIEMIKGGLDVHEATGKMMSVSRKQAKSVNFGLVYGQGDGALADSLKISLREAKSLRELYFARLPKASKFIDSVKATAKTRGYIVNWAGRRYYTPDGKSYVMPNRLIQGGGADIMKRGLGLVRGILKGTKSRCFLTVHDELDFYIHKSELSIVPTIKAALEGIYPSKHLPLTVSVSHSWKSLGDLENGGPSEA